LSCRKLKKVSRAEMLYKEAHTASLAVLGNDHYLTNLLEHDLAVLYCSQESRLYEGVRSFETLVKRCEGTFGAKHELTISCWRELGNAYGLQNRWAEAVEACEKVLDGYPFVVLDEDEDEDEDMQDRGQALKRLNEAHQREDEYIEELLADTASPPPPEVPVYQTTEDNEMSGAIGMLRF